MPASRSTGPTPGERGRLRPRAELVALARELPGLATLARVARRAIRRSGQLPALPDAQVEVVSAALAQLEPEERQALADALPAVRHLLAVLDAVDPQDDAPHP